MDLFSLFVSTVIAAEIVISPLPDGADIPGPPIPKTKFSQFISPLATGQVLGETTVTPQPEPTPLPADLSAEGLTKAEVPPDGATAATPRKKSFTIALLGDSMIDTLGPDIPDLQSQLASRFPTTNFTLLNYGVGGTNIDYGRERITNSYEYLGRQVASLVSRHPDIVVVESFGYNPFPDENRGVDRHWLAMAGVVDSLKKNLPGADIIIAATIAPNAKVFGDGAAGIAFSREDKWQRVDVIKKYLESTVAFAKSQHLPLADAFHPSLGPDGNGNLAYINAGDHIHTSPAGRQFFAGKVAEAIITNHLLK